MSFLSTAVQQVLEQGSFCAVASTTPRGPHCTPLVFAYSGGRVWLTTSRRSVKARAWKVDPGVAGLVRSGELSVTFTGTVRTYDVLDRSTWAAALSGATSIARAGTAFSKKNAKFFAGYAVDARQVPFAWMPPGRVFVGVDVERTALLGEDGVQEGRGRWGGESLSNKTFRSSKGGEDPAERTPRRRPGGAGERRRRARSPSPVRAGPWCCRSGGGWRAARSTRRSRPRPLRWRAPAPRLRSRSPWTVPRSGAPETWSAPWSQGTGAIFVLDDLGSGAKTRPRSGDVDRPRGRSARADHAGPHGLVEGVDQRESRGRIASPSDDDRRVLGGGRRAARARLGGHERSGEPPALGPAHRVGARPARRARPRGPLSGGDALHGVPDNRRGRGPRMGAAVAGRRSGSQGCSRPRSPLRSPRCPTNAACCGTRSRTGSADRSGGSARRASRRSAGPRWP